MKHISLLTVAILACTAFVTQPLLLQAKSNSQKTILLEADHLKVQSKKQAQATGNVQVQADQYKLFADELNYDLQNQQIKASGAIQLQSKNGHVVEAATLEASTDLKRGQASDVSAEFGENEYFAANLIEFDQDKKSLYKATYSPCVESNQQKCPTRVWDIRAEQATYDETKDELSFKRASLRMFSQPLFYVPSITIPAPKKTQSSGFLTPDLLIRGGATLKLPYHFALAPHKDLTITPSASLHGELTAEAEYRHLFHHGDLMLKGSIARFLERKNGRKTSDAHFAAHTESTGKFNDDNGWAWGFDAQRTTHKNYPASANLADRDRLTSRLYWTWDRPGTEFSMRSFSYQGLRYSDTQSQNTTVLPLIYYKTFGDVGSDYGTWFIETQGRSHYSSQRSNTHQLSINSGWNYPVLLANGVKLDLDTQLRGDAYHVRRSQRFSRQAGNHSAGRLYPLMAATFKYPLLISHAGSSNTTVVEPFLSTVVTARDNNPRRHRHFIPNLDSHGFELSSSNIMLFNRSPGLDRVSDDSRMTYGFSTDFFGNSNTRLFMAQSYAFNQPTLSHHVRATGLRKGFSDIVSNLRHSPNQRLTFSTEGRFSPNHKKFESGGIFVDYFGDRFVSETGLLFAVRAPGAISKKRIHSINQNIAVRMSKFWYAGIGGQVDLRRKQLRLIQGQLSYRDECFQTSITAKKSFTRNKFRDNSWSLLFSIGIKGLGGYDKTEGIHNRFSHN